MASRFFALLPQVVGIAVFAIAGYAVLIDPWIRPLENAVPGDIAVLTDELAAVGNQFAGRLILSSQREIAKRTVVVAADAATQDRVDALDLLTSGLVRNGWRICRSPAPSAEFTFGKGRFRVSIYEIDPSRNRRIAFSLRKRPTDEDCEGTHTLERTR